MPRILAWFLWAMPLFLLWLALVGTVDELELYAGAVAAALGALGIGPCLLVVVRAPIVDALVAVELAGVLATLVLVLLAEGFQRSSYWVLPLTASVLTIVGGLVFARFLERWL